MTQTPTDALRLVPVEPTREQELAMQRALLKDYPRVFEGEAYVNGKMLDAIYSAALAAAPASPLPGGGDELTSAREVLDLIERNPVLIGLKGEVSDSLLIETGYAMAAFIKSLPATPTGDAK